MAEVESTAVVVREDAAPQSGNFLQALLSMATDPNVDPSKVETLANLAVKLQDRERETQFNAALNAAIMEMPIITKEGIIKIPGKDGKPDRVQGRFAKFEDIYRVVKPILDRHQLAIRFDVGETQQATTVRPIISHANGFTERGDAMRLPADTSGSKNAVQAVGSSSQYGKRYTMCAMLNIVTEGLDTDGRGVELPVSLPDEREALVIAEAQAAFDAGTYLQWYSAASPKDRAWLLQTGRHTQFGGQTQLPPVKQPEPEPEPERVKPTGTSTQSSREKRAREWVDWFKGELALLKTAPAITELQDENLPTINTLQTAFPALYAELDRAISDKLASL